MNDQTILRRHGTTAFILRPSRLIAAAQEDLRRYYRNTDPNRSSIERYAFVAYHVRKVARRFDGWLEEHVLGTAAEMLLACAIADAERGQRSGKHWTRLIYSDVPLLRQAREEARRRVTHGQED
jgi:hypothetical protein